MFCKKGKLSPWHIGPFRKSKRVFHVAFVLELPQEFAAVNPVFHISMLKKCIGDPSLTVQTENVGLRIVYPMKRFRFKCWIDIFTSKEQRKLHH